MSTMQCRLCLAETDPNGGISMLDTTFKNAMDCVFQFKLPVTEGLSVRSCSQCMWTVLNFHSYAMLVERNQLKLATKTTQILIASDESSKMFSIVLPSEDDPLSDSNHGENSNEHSASEAERASTLAPVDPVDYLYIVGASPPSNDPTAEESPSSNSETRTTAHLKAQTSFARRKEAARLTFSSSKRRATNDNRAVCVPSAPAEQTIPRTKKLQCDRCKRTFFHRREYLHHMGPYNRCPIPVSERLPKKFPCDQCDAAFPFKWLLVRHAKTHLPAACPICEMQVNRSELPIHMHGHKQPHRCDVCNRGFESVTAYIKHKSRCLKLPIALIDVDDVGRGSLLPVFRRSQRLE